MRTVALFGIKGGVGKSTLAVNLAWTAALSARRILLWDLDPQGAATAMLGASAPPRRARRAMADGDLAPLVQPTRLPDLNLIAADESLRTLDLQLAEEDKRRRLARLIDSVAGDHDRIILDCPPGLTVLAERVFRAADLLVVPVPPSPLGERTLDQLRGHLATMKTPPPLLPVFNMVDRRRSLHREALAADPARPVVPQAAGFEGFDRGPLMAHSPETVAGRAVRSLWTAIEQRLAVRP